MNWNFVPIHPAIQHHRSFILETRLPNMTVDCDSSLPGCGLGVRQGCRRSGFSQLADKGMAGQGLRVK